MSVTTVLLTVIAGVMFAQVLVLAHIAGVLSAMATRIVVKLGDLESAVRSASRKRGGT